MATANIHHGASLAPVHSSIRRIAPGMATACAPRSRRRLPNARYNEGVTVSDQTIEISVPNVAHVPNDATGGRLEITNDAKPMAVVATVMATGRCTYPMTVKTNRSSPHE